MCKLSIILIIPPFIKKKNFYFSALIFESFGWILLNLEFICVIGTVLIYLVNWGQRVNFGNGIAEIQQKYEREREQVGERKFWISVIILPKFLLSKPADRVGVKCSKCANASWVPKGNQLWQCHCWNKRGEKFLWQCHCRKWEEKKNSGSLNLERNLKKKWKCYVYNIFTTNHRWLVTISSNLNLTLRLLF